MLQRLVPGWRGKLAVLVLLGFAFTDFVITMTLSAADSAAHLVENPYVPAAFHHPLGVTLVLLTLLSLVFLRGFHEAIGLAVVIGPPTCARPRAPGRGGLRRIDPEVLPASTPTAHAVRWRCPSRVPCFRLALGCPASSSGVSHAARGERRRRRPREAAGRIRERGACLPPPRPCERRPRPVERRRACSSPRRRLEKGSRASGRPRLSGPGYLGSSFHPARPATSTILWFAGASAMATLLNLVPLLPLRHGGLGARNQPCARLHRRRLRGDRRLRRGRTQARAHATGLRCSRPGLSRSP